MSSVSGVPLDKKEMISSLSNNQLPALHPHWASSHRFVAYVAPPQGSSDQGLMGEWLERLQYISTDLHWLLQLPHQKFWCQVIFDESLHQMLDSFLRYSPRPFDIEYKLTGGSRNLHDEVTRLVFFTFLRMATYKESKENWITPEVHGEIIYENFLFDVPKILDLCALYGHANTALLSKMMTNIFNQQPKYLDDLQTAVPIIFQVFDNIVYKCGQEAQSDGFEPQKLNASHSHQQDMVNMKTDELQDVLFYLADTAVTLTCFLTVYPAACVVLHKLQFCSQLAHLYEKLIPAFQHVFKQKHFDNLRLKKMLRSKLRQAKHHLLSAFHLIVFHSCLQPVLNNTGKEDDTGSISYEINQHMEDFLEVMSSVLTEKRFLADYEGQFSFQDDMDILSQAVRDLDETHYKYIMEAINAAFAAHGKRKKPKGNKNTGGRTSPDGSPYPSLAPSSAQPRSNQTSTAIPADKLAPILQGAEVTAVTGVELDSLVHAVKDLLPHLGKGFIAVALEELGYDVESVVSAVLEDQLPDKLRHVDFTLDSFITTAIMEKPTSESLVESRRNIFDNDEFDVFNNPEVHVEQIHKGKRSVEASVLDEKESIKELKPLYDAYGSMDVASMYDPQMYDDEYDDTYDVNNIGADDADSADELTQRRGQKLCLRFYETNTSVEKENRGLREERPLVPPSKSDKREQQDDSNGDDISDEEETANLPNQFVQDPAELRERQAQRFASQNPGRLHSRDVKGKSKGQGQTEDVLRNRKFKEKNKGMRANHNRRAMSDKKHSRGMF